MTIRQIISWPIARLLAPLIGHNYRERFAGRLPDEWYWADRIMVHLGWYATIEGKLRRKCI